MTLDFLKILNEHTERYPLMTSQDYCKLAYQSEFGPRHMLASCDKALVYIDKEWSELEDNMQIRSPEPIGNGLCRFYMNKSDYSKTSSELLGELFYLTAQNHSGSQDGLYKRLNELKKLPVTGIEEYIADYKAQGCPAVHHSQIYNKVYKPHYRLLRWEYACYFNILLEIKKINKPAIIAIDGRCGSGKTSLAILIQTIFKCNVFHIDDYYLPMSQRDENWENIPAGNIDLIRFKNEVLKPAKEGEPVLYHPYICSTGEFGDEQRFSPSPITVIEGSYSHHPQLCEAYDLKIFLTSDKDVQKRRLIEREGDYYKMFEHRWIPMEELYLSTFDIEKNSDVVLDTSSIF